MANKPSNQPKPNLQKKPLDTKEEKERIKTQTKQRLAAEKERIITQLLTEIAFKKRMGVGVGNQEEFYKELEDGFKSVLSAKGIKINDELEKIIKENGGRLIPKENLPKIENLSVNYGIVPNQ